MKDIMSPKEKAPHKSSATHRKNTKSMKFNQESLKAILVEKLQKRYDFNQQPSIKRTLDRASLPSSQKSFKIPNVKFNGKTPTGKFSQKKFLKRRKSNQSSRDSLSKKHNIFR